MQNSGNCKKGECPEDHLGFKNRNKKISTKNVTVKNRHIHRHHCTKLYKCYRQIFKIFKYMFFMDGTEKEKKLSRKVITNPSFASFFVCEIKDSELPITRSFWILIIDTVDVQFTKWLHLSFLSSSQLGRGRGGLRVTLLD